MNGIPIPKSESIYGDIEWLLRASAGANVLKVSNNGCVYDTTDSVRLHRIVGDVVYLHDGIYHITKSGASVMLADSADNDSLLPSAEAVSELLIAQDELKPRALATGSFCVRSGHRGLMMRSVSSGIRQVLACLPNSYDVRIDYLIDTVAERNKKFETYTWSWRLQRKTGPLVLARDKGPGWGQRIAAIALFENNV